MPVPRSKSDQPEAAQAAPSAPAARLPQLQRLAVSTEAPRLPPRPWFWLCWHPERWTLCAGRVVPLFCEEDLANGVNGTVVVYDRDTGQTTVDTSGLESNLRARGFTPVPWEADGASYIVEAAPGAWVTRWTRTTPGSAHTELDVEAFFRWLDALQASGVLPTPQPRHLDALAERLRIDAGNPDHQRDPHRLSIVREQLDAVTRLRGAA